MTLPPFVRNILIACGFLGRIALPPSLFRDFDGRYAAIAHCFPAAGFLLALPGAALFWLLLAAGAPTFVAAFAALAVQALATGALHEDGLADCADGFGGGRTREAVLDIMKDSRIGSYGTIALILSFGLRASALAGLAAALSPLAAAALLPASGALARAFMVAHWQALPSARRQGLAASLGQPDVFIAAAALVSGTLLAGIPTLATLGLPAFFLAIALSSSGAFLVTRLARQRINGHTGDTIGAVEQTVEIAALVAFSIAA